MGHPQNSPRGLWAKRQIDIASGGNSVSLTPNSSGLVLDGGVKVSNARHISANSTAFVLDAESALPSTDQGAAITLVSNSTGVALAINSTGTTWKYLNVTADQPT